MLRAYTAGSMYEAEAPALAEGQPLMARAARALADVVGGYTPPRARIVVFAGNGNNGADGLYAAGHLAGAGHAVTAVITFDGSLPQGAGAGGLAAARRAGVQILPAGDEARVREVAAGAGLWVDGLTGIGMRPPARGAVADLLGLLINLRRGAPRPPLVFAVDLPSGLGADGGGTRGPVLEADHTVTFGGYKAAHFLPPAALACGHVHLVDIGIAGGIERQEPAVLRVGAPDIAAWWPRPSAQDHKYTRGVVGVVTGSPDYPGAGVLAVAGALGAGPGMVRYLGGAPGHVISAYPEAVTQEGRVQAWVTGSGISGTASPTAPDLARALTRGAEERVPIVVDAGALEWVGPGTLAGLAATPRVVLTPHAGELASLLGRLGREVSRQEVEADPAPWAARTSELTGASVLLKGAVTVVACEGEVFSQDDGTPWMASAGSGDVLAGILGTVLAGWQVGQETGAGAWPGLGAAIAAGVALHGIAGVRASGGGPLRAGEIAAAVPSALRELLAH